MLSPSRHSFEEPSITFCGGCCCSEWLESYFVPGLILVQFCVITMSALESRREDALHVLRRLWGTVGLRDRAGIWTQQAEARTQFSNVELPVLYVLLTL